MANEKRLIWDEDAKRHLIALAVGHHTETLHIDMILNAILHHTTTVDAVEVGRCRDCKHLEPFSDGALYCGHIRGLAGSVLPEYFCSYGEKRTGEGREGE